MMAADFYQTLGVQRNADERELKTAYRKLARQYHPDVNPSPTAKEKFQEINNAYEVLSNPEMRARYDQFGEAGIKGGMGGGGGPGVDFDLGDIFESFFGGGGGRGGPGGRRPRGPPQGACAPAFRAMPALVLPQRHPFSPRAPSFPRVARADTSRPALLLRCVRCAGEDLRFDLEIDFKTAVFGGERSVRVNHLEVGALTLRSALHCALHSSTAGPRAQSGRSKQIARYACPVSWPFKMLRQAARPFAPACWLNRLWLNASSGASGLRTCRGHTTGSAAPSSPIASLARPTLMHRSCLRLSFPRPSSFRPPSQTSPFRRARHARARASSRVPR